jgi:sec-independent protein translocase protein TatA
MMPSIGPMEVVVVLAIALIVFGPKRLPDLAKSLGSSVREFKESVTNTPPQREVSRVPEATHTEV